MVQNLTSGTDPKILDLVIKCLDFGLTVILYTIYAVELKPAIQCKQQIVIIIVLISGVL